MKERRDYSRTDFPGDISYEVCSSVDPETAEERIQGRGTVVNVSGSGLCLDTREAVKDSQILKINIPLPGTSVHVPTLAMVMWTRAHNTGSRAGLMFVI